VHIYLTAEEMASPFTDRKISSSLTPSFSALDFADTFISMETNKSFCITMETNVRKMKKNGCTYGCIINTCLTIRPT
jgi:hypothetical protein